MTALYGTSESFDTFDFSEFEKVKNAKPGPVMERVKELAGKYGTEQIHILTARPQAAALAIQAFMKSNGFILLFLISSKTKKSSDANEGGAESRLSVGCLFTCWGSPSVPSGLPEDLGVSFFLLSSPPESSTSVFAPPIIGFGLFISVFDLLKGWVS